MLDLARCKRELLHLVDAVVNELLAKSTQLCAEDVMVVGATCRDLLQGALGHDFALRATGGNATIRIPTVAGYASLKLAAWLDRSADREFKDAYDIATVVYWYSESSEVASRLFDTPHGHDILVREDMDDTAATARVLGEDIASVIGRARVAELAERWPGPRSEQLYPSMTGLNAPGWTRSPNRWRALIRAMERGIGIGSAD